MDRFLDMVLEIQPTQVALVPDAVGALTSNAGWDTLKHQEYLSEIISECKRNGIRTSIFVDPVLPMIEELQNRYRPYWIIYWSFAHQYSLGNEEGVNPYVERRNAPINSLGINAGHDLSLQNIRF